MHFGAFLNRDTDNVTFVIVITCTLYEEWLLPQSTTLSLSFFSVVCIFCETQYHYLMLSNPSDEFIPRVSTRLIFAMFTRCLCLDIYASTVSFRRACALLHFVPLYDVFSFLRKLITSSVYMVTNAVKLCGSVISFLFILISVYVPTYQIMVM